MKAIACFLSLVMTACMCSRPAEPRFELDKMIVFITIKVNGNDYAFGSGTVIDYKSNGEAWVLTADHVVDVPSSIALNVAIEVKNSYFSAIVDRVVRNEGFDSALLHFHSPTPLSAALLDNNVYPLQEVYNSGWPLALGQAITRGIVNYPVAKDLGTPKVWMCSAPSYPGNSGGGIFDKNTKKLIGMSLMLGAASSPIGKVPVPHLHVFIPIKEIHAWIKETLL